MTRYLPYLAMMSLISARFVSITFLCLLCNMYVSALQKCVSADPFIPRTFMRFITNMNQSDFSQTICSSPFSKRLPPILFRGLVRSPGYTNHTSQTRHAPRPRPNLRILAISFADNCLLPSEGHRLRLSYPNEAESLHAFALRLSCSPSSRLNLTSRLRLQKRVPAVGWTLPDSVFHQAICLAPIGALRI